MRRAMGLPRKDSDSGTRGVKWGRRVKERPSGNSKSLCTGANSKPPPAGQARSVKSLPASQALIFFSLHQMQPWGSTPSVKT